jgi:hypothetical protein
LQAGIIQMQLVQTCAMKPKALNWISPIEAKHTPTLIIAMICVWTVEGFSSPNPKLNNKTMTDVNAFNIYLVQG